MNRKIRCEPLEVEEQTIYQCEYCEKTFTRKQNIDSHMERCKLKDCEIRKKEIELQKKVNLRSTHCRYCEREFSRSDVRTKHMEKCRRKDEYLEELKEEEKKRALERRNETKESKEKGGTNNGVIVGRDNNGMIINIQLAPFGQENFDYIDTNKVIQLVNRFLKCRNDMAGFIRALTKEMHCNPKHPQNMNILMDGTNKSLATVFTENGFERLKATEVSQAVVTRGGHLTLDVYEMGDDNEKAEISKRVNDKVDENVLATSRDSKMAGTLRRAAKEVLSGRTVKEKIRNVQKSIENNV